MVKDEQEEGRLFALGINSFMKGCSSATITGNQTSQFNFIALQQHSENPREGFKIIKTWKYFLELSNLCNSYMYCIYIHYN